MSDPCLLCGEPLGYVSGNFGLIAPGPIVYMVHPRCFTEKGLGITATNKSMTKAVCKNCGQTMARWEKDANGPMMLYNHGSDGRCWSPKHDGSVLDSFWENAA